MVGGRAYPVSQAPVTSRARCHRIHPCIFIDREPHSFRIRSSRLHISFNGTGETISNLDSAMARLIGQRTIGVTIRGGSSKGISGELIDLSSSIVDVTLEGGAELRMPAIYPQPQPDGQETAKRDFPNLRTLTIRLPPHSTHSTPHSHSLTFDRLLDTVRKRTQEPVHSSYRIPSAPLPTLRMVGSEFLIGMPANGVELLRLYVSEVFIG